MNLDGKYRMFRNFDGMLRQPYVTIVNHQLTIPFGKDCDISSLSSLTCKRMLIMTLNSFKCIKSTFPLSAFRKPFSLIIFGNGLRSDRYNNRNGNGESWCGLFFIFSLLTGCLSSVFVCTGI